MSRKQYTIHYIYKTTNILNRNFYVGMHSTFNLDDGYLGSGKRLWYSINKYGKENHKKEILEYCKDRKKLKKREKEIVNESLIKNKMCMNLKMGGEGGFSSKKHQRKATLASHISYKHHLDADPTFRKKMFNIHSQVWKRLQAECIFKTTRFKEKKHSEETKKKISETRKERGCGIGEKNSQFGTMWITNGEKTRKIKKLEIIPVGWNKGRTLGP